MSVYPVLCFTYIHVNISQQFVQFTARKVWFGFFFKKLTKKIFMSHLVFLYDVSLFSPGMNSSTFSSERILDLIACSKSSLSESPPGQISLLWCSLLSLILFERFIEENCYKHNYIDTRLLERDRAAFTGPAHFNLFCPAQVTLRCYFLLNCVSGAVQVM